jgi:murein DD-endopeptidase MepM/ murein hydrolase activator NlpD
VFVDTIPPQHPTFKIKTDTNKREIYMEILTSDWNKLYVFNKAGVHTTITKPVQKVVLIRNNAYDTTYAFAVQAVDGMNNYTPKTKYISIKTPPVPGVGGGTEIESYKYPPSPKKGECKIQINLSTNEVDRKECTIPSPIINRVEHTVYEQKLYFITTYGSYNPTIRLALHTYTCKSKVWYDPRTWFTCVKINQRDVTQEITLNSGFRILIDGNLIHSPAIIDANGTKLHYGVSTYTDMTHHTLQLYYVLAETYKYKDVPINFWLESPLTKRFTIPKASELTQSDDKYFRFPFNKYIGVTQWHGNTAYQHPHTGIDFGAFKEPVYATADGYIRKAQWDNYLGPCLSGGNFVMIAHDNGYYSLYLHLDSYTNEAGRTWHVGDRIKKGDMIGTTGNTGAFNCQPIGYHLHYEIRTDQWQKNHTNPVPLTDIDWSRIHTLGYEIYPGRLSGNNPHPTY